MNYILTALILIGYEFNFFFNLKPLFGISKEDYKKPFDCFFCLSFWGNTLAIVGLHIYMFIRTEELTFCYYEVSSYALSLLITKIIDLSWNK